MVVFPGAIQGILSQPLIEICYLVDIDDGDILRSTTYWSNVTLSDGRTFVADGQIVNLDAPRLSTVVDKEQYKIVLADPSFYFGQYAENGMVGKRVEVIACFIDQTTGAPVTSAGNSFTVYKGRVDAASYAINTGVIGSATISILCASPMADLDLRKQFLSSRDFVRNRTPNDSCCDQVYEGSGAIQLRWGK